MDGTKSQELLRGLLDTLSDEQREKAGRCRNAAALFSFLGEEGVAIPDELLDEAAGGAGVGWDKCSTPGCKHYAPGGGLCSVCLKQLNEQYAPSGGTVSPSGQINYWAQEDNFR